MHVCVCVCVFVCGWVGVVACDTHNGKLEEVVSQFVLESAEETDHSLTGSTPCSIDINHCKRKTTETSLQWMVMDLCKTNL